MKVLGGVFQVEIAKGNAVGFPAFFNWSPSVTASGSMTFTLNVLVYARFQVVGNQVSFWVRTIGATGGSPSNAISYELPVASSNEDFSRTIGHGSILDGGYIAGRLTIPSGVSTSFTSFKHDNTNWGIGGSRQMQLWGQYWIS